ncbi:MAG: PLP-dependent aminotransferase family protein, partial [Verrucomicrobiota bacterium]
MPTPLYQTLYEHFRDAILSGDLKPNTRLPSSRLLSQQRGCSRNTVNQAYEMLIAEGYAEPRPGSGTYVTPTLPDTFHLPSSSSSKNTIATSPPNRPPHPRQFTTSSSSDAQYKLPLPLSHGVPDLESFPRETWLKLYNRYLRKSPYSLIHYGHPQGYLPLRQAIATYLNTHRGARCDPSQILIVSGSQHGLDLVARTLLHPKDKVWLESPTYLGAHTSFKQTNAKLLPIPVEEDGMNVPWAIDALS